MAQKMTPLDPHGLGGVYSSFSGRAETTGSKYTAGTHSTFVVPRRSSTETTYASHIGGEARRWV